MWVYFIRAGNRGAIKIGWAKDVDRRMTELQIGNAFKLTLITKIKCDSKEHAAAMEQRFHRFFAKQRIRGEWFMSTINLSKLRDINAEHLREEKLMLGEQERYDQKLLDEQVASDYGL